MMKLTVPKNSRFKLTRQGSNLFYVTSEKNQGETYMVVQHEEFFFCQCNDFFARKLPTWGGTAQPFCKHGEFVKQVVEAVPGAQIVEAVKAGKNASTITGTVKV